MSYQRIAIILGLHERSDEDAILKRLEARLTEARRDRVMLSKLCEFTGQADPNAALGVAFARASSGARGGAAAGPFGEMTFAERAALKRKDAEGYRALKSAEASEPWAGKSYAEMSNMEKHALKRADPERYRTMRNAAQQAG